MADYDKQPPKAKPKKGGKYSETPWEEPGWNRKGGEKKEKPTD
jgi:hypothetical protein